MKQILWFLKEQLPTVLLTLAAPLVFFLVAFLYDIAMEPLGYACLLYALLWLISWVSRYLRFRRKHQERLLLRQRILVDQRNLPAAKTLAERDYLEMLRLLGQRVEKVLEEQSCQRTEQQDYYTLWVHQVKVPISAMRLLLQTEQLANGAALEAELFRIEQYAEMALGYIRLEESPNDLEIREIRLDEWIRKSLRKYAPVFISKKLRLCYEPTDMTAVTDAKWLSFLLEQLLSNAVKYTQAGQVTVSVSPDLKITIADTGIGIAGHDLPRIFEKGFTGQNGRLNGSSTGLGLYLCARTAKMLNVTLSVQSEIGKGSAFTVDLGRQREPCGE